MAALPPPAIGMVVPPAGPPPPMAPFSVIDAMVECGVDNVVQWNGETAAERIAEGIFGNDYETMMSTTMEEVVDLLKSYKDLTVANGRIVLQPHVHKRIKAFVQWTRDQIRMGLDPADTLFPVVDTNIYLKNYANHKKFVDNATANQKATEPQIFTKNIMWDDWNQTFRHYVGNIPGHNGVPLSYVIRENPIPDPTPMGSLLANYVAMAPLDGEAFVHDDLRLLGLINKYIVGNDVAEGAVKACNTTTSGRDAYLALKVQYEGEGMMQDKVLRAEHQIETLFYNGNEKGMSWDKFERELGKAYAIIDNEAGRVVFDDTQKIRKLQKRLEKCAFLAPHRAAISSRLIEIPVTLTFKQAMQYYRNAVRTHYPAGSNSRNYTSVDRRGISEVNQRGRGNGRGGNGGGGRGRGGRNQGRQDRRHNANNNRYHRDMEQVTLTNGKKINYHPAFRFTDEELALFPEELKTKMRQQRAEYRRRNGGNGNNGGNRTDRELAEIRSTLASLVQQRNVTAVPDAISTNNQTQVSQVSVATGRGRNAQRQRRQQESRSGNDSDRSS